MIRFAPLSCMTMLVVVIVGCGQGASSVPTAPSTVARPISPVPQPPSPGVRGDIAIAAITHPSGDTLLVHDCGPSWTGIAGNHRCNEDWRGAFDVVIDSDVSNIYITVSFEHDGQRCGQVEVGGQNFAAGRTRLISTEHPLYLTYEPEGYDNLAVTEYCRFDPRTTNQVVVRLWGDNHAVPLLQKAFDLGYRFEGGPN